MTRMTASSGTCARIHAFRSFRPACPVPSASRSVPVVGKGHGCERLSPFPLEETPALATWRALPQWHFLSPGMKTLTKALPQSDIEFSDVP